MSWSANDYARGYRLVALPCGCQDVEYLDGFVDEEHTHIECDGEPERPRTEELPEPSEYFRARGG